MLLLHLPSRLLQTGVLCAGLFVSAAAVHAQVTDAQLTAANLAGKTLTFTIQNAQAPLATSGSYTIALNAAGNAYTLANVSGNTTAAAGACAFSNNGFATLTLTGFVSNLEPLVLSLFTQNGTGRFELNRADFTNAGFQTGTFIIGTGSGGGPTTAAAFQNGSFETGPSPGSSSVTLGTTATTLTGWRITAGDVDYFGTAWLNADGVRGLDLNGNSGATVAQTFTTVAGRTYTVTFDLAGHPGSGTGTGVKTITVTATGSNGAGLASNNYTFDTTGRTLAAMGWSNKSFTFVADGTSATLTFQSTTAGLFGPAIDNVRLDGALGSAGGLAAASIAAPAGGTVSLTAPTTGSSYQWQRNGTAVSGATNATLSLANISSDAAGIYAAAVAGALNFAFDQFAIVGVATTSKVIGAGAEIGPDIPHQNGITYDQLLISGTAATLTADPAQVTRLSLVDLQNDIIQVEFTGAGTVSIVLEGSSGPANPVNYIQPTVSYMKGHAGIIVTGADETSHLTIFSVGRNNAVNQSLFRNDVTYDGMADLAFVAIHSRNGKFGGLRTANVSYFATKGLTGVYAPAVQFQGPVYVGDINASGTATPVLVIGGSNDVRVTGGDLQQTNAAAVQVAGFRAIRFTANANSHNVAQAAQPNRATFMENGSNVTSTITVSP